MLMPKKVKFRKRQKGRMKGKAMRGNTVDFGQYGLKALEPGRISNRQIEAARIAISRAARRGGKLWIRIFPDRPITKKPAETRMGKGKGPLDGWVVVIRPGRILYEVDGLTEEVARKALRLAAQKLPVRTKIVTRYAG